jgi:hypothetical protein
MIFDDLNRSGHRYLDCDLYPCYALSASNCDERMEWCCSTNVFWYADRDIFGLGGQSTCCVSHAMKYFPAEGEIKVDI